MTRDPSKNRQPIFSINLNLYFFQIKIKPMMDDIQKRGVKRKYQSLPVRAESMAAKEIEITYERKIPPAKNEHPPFFFGADRLSFDF